MSMLQLREKFCLFPRTTGSPKMLELHRPNQKSPQTKPDSWCLQFHVSKWWSILFLTVSPSL